MLRASITISVILFWKVFTLLTLLLVVLLLLYAACIACAWSGCSVHTRQADANMQGGDIPVACQFTHKALFAHMTGTAVIDSYT